MRPLLLDVVWPALYISETFWQFWFLIAGTIVVELFTIKRFLRFSWRRSLFASLIGNCVSGVIGTFLMVWAMLPWHMIVDNFVPHATFDPINWVASYVLMCLGSVLIETLVIKFTFREPIKKIFLPMLIGNLLSYAFIAFVMITKTDKDPDEVKFEYVKYLPLKRSFILLDKSAMHFDTASVRVSYDKNGRRLNDTKNSGYEMNINFKQQYPDNFQFNLLLRGAEFSGGIERDIKRIHLNSLNEQYVVLMEQKNPDTSLGWTEPIITDTITFQQIIPTTLH